MDYVRGGFLYTVLHRTKRGLEKDIQGPHPSSYKIWLMWFTLTTSPTYLSHKVTVTATFITIGSTETPFDTSVLVVHLMATFFLRST